MGRPPKNKKAGPKASPPKLDASDDDETPLKDKIDESQIEWLDASSIDRSKTELLLRSQKFKPTSDVIPYDRKEAVSQEIFVYFEDKDDEDPTLTGVMYRGIVDRYLPMGKQAKSHHVIFADGDKKYFKLAEETVIWPDGAVTGPESKWKGEEGDKKQAGGGGGGSAGGGSSGKTRGRTARGAAAEEEEKEKKKEEDKEVEKQQTKTEPAPALAPAAAAATAPVVAEPAAPVAAAVVEEGQSKKRKAPSSAEKKEAETEKPPIAAAAAAEEENLEIIATEPAAPAVEPAVEAAAPPQQKEKDQQQQQPKQEQKQEPKQQQPEPEIAPTIEQLPTSPKQPPQPPTASTSSAERHQSKKPKLQQQQQPVPRGVVKPPPPPPNVPPSKRDSFTTTPSTGAPLGPPKPPKSQQRQQQNQAGGSKSLSSDPKIAALQQKHRLLEDASQKYRAALETLKTSSETIMSLVKELTSEDVDQANKAGIPRLVGTTVKQTLQPPSGNGGGASNTGWFEVHGMKWLNDVPEAMASMRELLNTWFESKQKPTMPEGPHLKAWIAERSQGAAPAPASGLASAAKDSAAGAAGKKPLPHQQQQAQKHQQHQQQQLGKSEEESNDDVIPSTGDEMRDKVVRVLAHALVTATTPIDAAREMEQAMFYQLCNSKHNNNNDTDKTTTAAGGGSDEVVAKRTAGGGDAVDEGKPQEDSKTKVNEAYYGRMRVIWEALSPKSPTCHPIIRYMLLTGMIAPTELVNITAEQLKIKQEEAIKQLSECKPGWLAEQLRNVQLPYHPPPTTTAAAAAVVPGSNEVEGSPVAASVGVQPADAGNGNGNGGNDPKVVDMELD